MKTTRLIGRRWKYSNVCSWPILIGRGLDLNFFWVTASYKSFHRDFYNFYELIKWKQRRFCVCTRNCLLCSCQSSGKEIERKKFLNGGNAEKIRQGVNERMTSEKGCIVFKNIIRICLTVMVWYITIVVIIAERFHLFPYRTQKLSFLTPKVLVGTLTGRIGHRHFPSFCRLLDKNNRKYCSLAQSVEHRTVNPSVVSSSLTGAAIMAVQKSCHCKKSEYLCKILAFFCLKLHNYWIIVEIIQSKNRAKCCKNTAVISRRVRLELTTFVFLGNRRIIYSKWKVSLILFQGDLYCLVGKFRQTSAFCRITQVFYNK